MEQQTSGGFKISLGGALAVLLLFFTPWVSCGAWNATGLDLATDKSMDSSGWIFLVPFSAIAVIGMLFLFRSAGLDLRASSWARIICSLVGAIPLVGLYSKTREGWGFIKVEYGLIGTAIGIGAMIAGGIMDILSGRDFDSFDA